MKKKLIDGDAIMEPTIVVHFGTLEDMGLAAQQPGKPLRLNPEVEGKGLAKLEERLKMIGEQRRK